MKNILYCGNGKVFDGVLSSALSILMRTKSEEPIRVFVFTMDITRIKPEYTAISDEDVAFLDETLKSYNPENSAIKVDVGDIYERELGGCPNETAYCSPYTLLRLLADEVDIIGDDKLLYLDADIAFNRDIDLLYGKDVEGYEYAAARDHYGKYILRPDYINAGVLLFNMKKCRETGIFAKARELLRKKKYLFADQSALFRATTKKLMLPQRFNDQKFLHKHTVVRHFSKRLFWLPYPHTDNIKQWQTDKVRKVFGYEAFDDVFDEYERLKKIYEQTKETKMNNKDVVLFFSFDENYAPCFAAAVESIKTYADADRNYILNCLYAGNIGEETRDRLIAAYSKGNISIKFYDITENIKDVFSKLHTRDYYDKSTYYRLFIPRLFPEYDKALYLDSDIILRADVAELFDIDLGDNLVGGIPDESVQLIDEFKMYAINKIGVDPSKYFNAGILPMNCARLREVDFEGKFIKLLGLVTFDVAQDQDYLNAICKGKVRYIGAEWDKMPIDPYSVKEEDIKLIHFNLDFKPWKRDGVMYEKYFYEYADKCIYADEIRKIKATTDPKEIEIMKEQTENLIATCVKQANDTEENERIKRVLEELWR